jgi:NAD-dependent deacetylase
MTNEAMLRQAADVLRTSRAPSVLTGAGASKESGIPTFRDALEGLWAHFDPTELATREAFRRNPKQVWDFYEFRRALMAPARPHAGHQALAALERWFPTLPIITQNVDNLHEQAGSHHVIHLHGSIHRNKCFYDCQGAPTPIDLSVLTWDRDSGPPSCPYCGRWVRPDVVWFGEMLPLDSLTAAEAVIDQTDVMLVVGTSGIVTPAALMPSWAKQNGAFIIELNPFASEITPLADLWIPQPAGQSLPALVEYLG